MKVAFSSDDNKGLDSTIAHHFGRCPFYVFVEIEGEEVTSIQGEENPYYQSHVPGAVPKYIAEKNAQIIVAGGMGPRAVSLFEELNISPVVGAAGLVRDALTRIIKGEYSTVTKKSYDPSKHDKHKGEMGHGS
jgi:predicted Fe-Mo cluster-binding NifX family protein